VRRSCLSNSLIQIIIFASSVDLRGKVAGIAAEILYNVLWKKENRIVKTKI